MDTIIIALIHWAVVSVTMLVALGVAVMWLDRDAHRGSAADMVDRPPRDWAEEYRQDFRRRLTNAEEAQVELAAGLAVFAAKVYDDNIVGREQANHDAPQVREMVRLHELAVREVATLSAKLANIAGPVPNEMDIRNPLPEVSHLYDVPVTITIDGVTVEQEPIAYNISEGWVRVYSENPRDFGVVKVDTLKGEVAVTFHAEGQA